MSVLRTTAVLLMLAFGATPAVAAAAADGGNRLGVERMGRGETPATELVVLVHGLGRTKLSMLPLEWTLERAGYEVLNWGYWSTCCTVEELAAALASELDSQPEIANRRVHFVGHSLGGIVVRAMLAAQPPEHLGRVVMLAPPNRGSEMADRFARPLGWFLRPLPDITTGRSSAVLRLPPPTDVEVGVIAGQFDGKVSVRESHLPGEADHVVVPSAHTFIMNRADVRRLVVTFLQSGRFAPPRRDRVATLEAAALTD